MDSLAKTLRALFLGVALVSLMVACVGYLALNTLRSPVGDSAEPVEFVVEQGDSTSAIATKLAEAKLIRVPLVFTLLVRSQGLDGSLKAGTYALRPNMNMSQIISSLQVSQKIEEVSVQVIEGLRLEEIARVVGESGLKNVDEQSFLDAAYNGESFKERFILLQDLPPGADLEGYLFPDTYRLNSTSTVTDVIDTMLGRFTEQYQTFETSVQVDRNVHEIVTMASIVQREAAREDEMNKIAAVFWNRLKPEYADETGGGKLQADPTLQYALGTPDDWWPDVNLLTLEQIDGNTSPYNTRVVAGLPPGPISNPGLAALQAAAQPDQAAPYLYFVASCTDVGAHNFATSFEEFSQYEQEYQNCPQP